MMAGNKLSKREQSKIRKAFEKNIGEAIRHRIKGTPWRKKWASIFQADTDWFIEVEARIHHVSGQFNGRFKAKPMGLDPIFWDIMGLPDNRSQTLSFRMSGAFVTFPVEFFQETILNNPEDPDKAAKAFMNWVEKRHKSFRRKIANKPYSQFILEDPKFETMGVNAVPLVCALILEGERERALQFAKAFSQEGHRQTTFNYSNSNGSFFKNAAEWLTAERK